MTHHFNEPLWQQVRKERMRRKGLITEESEVSETDAISGLVISEEPDPLVIVKDGRVLFAIRSDGTVEGEKVDANEAAKIFAASFIQEVARLQSQTQQCCPGGPQWGQAWSCPTLP